MGETLFNTGLYIGTTRMDEFIGLFAGGMLVGGFVVIPRPGLRSDTTPANQSLIEFRYDFNYTTVDKGI
jgi:hypothetical protein